MARSSMVVIAVVATAVCFSFLIGSANAASGSLGLFVEGQVYCDTCRVEFQTKLSEPLDGAIVKLECRSRENNSLTFSEEAMTDKTGTYRIPVEDDHEEDICEVKLVRSPKEDCSEPFWSTDKARIALTRNLGVVDSVRYANALGYKKKDALSGCEKILQEMGFLPIEGNQ